MNDHHHTRARRRTAATLLAGVVSLLMAGALVTITASGQTASSAAAGSKARGTLKLVVEFNRFADARDEVAPEGDSTGDQVIYSDPVFDAKNKKRLGRAMFANTFQEGSNVLVAGAIRLRDGTITLAGTLLNGAPSIAVTGGTGAYAGARGTYRQSNKEIELLGEDGPGRYPATIVFIR